MIQRDTCFVREDYSFKGRSSQDGRKKNSKEGQEIFDLKPLIEEEIAWLEEHFIDFAREQ